MSFRVRRTLSSMKSSDTGDERGPLDSLKADRDFDIILMGRSREMKIFILKYMVNLAGGECP